MAIPNTFTNGTLADADEVNANFTYVMKPKIRTNPITSNLTTTDADFTTKQTFDLSANLASSFFYCFVLSSSATSGTGISAQFLVTLDDDTTEVVSIGGVSHSGSEERSVRGFNSHFNASGKLIKQIEWQAKRTDGTGTPYIKASNFEEGPSNNLQGSCIFALTME